MWFRRRKDSSNRVHDLTSRTRVAMPGGLSDRQLADVAEQSRKDADRTLAELEHALADLERGIRRVAPSWTTELHEAEGIRASIARYRKKWLSGSINQTMSDEEDARTAAAMQVEYDAIARRIYVLIACLQDRIVALQAAHAVPAQPTADVALLEAAIGLLLVHLTGDVL